MKHILLCGNSIPLAGLAASLCLQPELAVVPTDLADLAAPPGPDDVVIADAAQAAEVLALLRPHPAWRLLSVDAATGTLHNPISPAGAVAPGLGNACFLPRP